MAVSTNPNLAGGLRPRWVARLDVALALASVVGFFASAGLSLDVTPTIGSPRLWAAWFDVAPLARAPAAFLELAVVLAAAAALALGRARPRAEVVLLVSLHVAAVLEASVRGTVMSSVEPLLIGQVLLARIVARMWVRSRGGDAEALGHEFACGVVGAAFFAAAIAKLVLTGPAFVVRGLRVP